MFSTRDEEWAEEDEEEEKEEEEELEERNILYGVLKS